MKKDNSWLDYIKNLLLLLLFRFAAKGWISAKWFEPDFPSEDQRMARTGILRLEIVSHCWNYSHLLVYQLSSLVNYPPRCIKITMTVFYCPEDSDTTRLLEYFGGMNVPGVSWNWWALPREKLFRRGIGRNLAALETKADWVWFTDCDLIFRDKCLDTLAALLQNRRDALVYPEEERCTELLEDDNPMLQAGSGELLVLDIDPESFAGHKVDRATGPLQIAHGDVCRAVGYCRTIEIYQTPSEAWCKAHEDEAFRWLLRTQGIPLKIPEVYRIKHISKGRYAGSSRIIKFRMILRKLQAKIRGY